MVWYMYGMVWNGVVWYGMVWCGMVWCGMVWYGMESYRGQVVNRAVGEGGEGAGIWQRREGQGWAEDHGRGPGQRVRMMHAFGSG